MLGGLPDTACGMPVDVLLVDDGSTDRTADIGRELGARVVSHERSRGLGAGLRTGLELARDEGYAAAVYLDGDGEYDPLDFQRVLDPVARGRADYVIGSRFLGPREGMSWHRNLANRTTSALVGFLTQSVTSDGQSGYRAFSARALAEARIAHDYNYAQVLTLSLWGAGMDAVEVPISYRRRTTGRSFVRYPEYLARVGPAVWRQWRISRQDEEHGHPGDRPCEGEGPVVAVVEDREQPGERAERRVGPVGHERAAREARVGVEPGAAHECQRGEHEAGARRVAQAEGHERHGERKRRHQVPRREPEAEHRGGEEGGHEQLGAEGHGAEAGGELGVADAGERAREVLAVGAPEPPHAGEGEREHGGPAEQAVVAVDEEGHQPVGAVEVAAGERGVGGGLAGVVGVIGGHAAVQRLVDAHVEGHAEERDLHRADGERPPARAPEGAGGDEADGQARGHELRAEPGEEAEEGEAEEGLASPDARVQAQGQKGGAGERGAGAELGVYGGAVGEEGGTQAHHRGGADGPRVGHHPERKAIGQGHGQRGDGGEEQLHPLGPADQVGGQDEEREAHAVGLVQPALGERAVLVEPVGVEVGVGAGRRTRRERPRRGRASATRRRAGSGARPRRSRSS